MITQWAPSRASLSAMPRPMPREPPVTTATRPASGRSSDERRATPDQARKSRQSASHMVAERRSVSVSTRSLLPWNISGYSV